MLIYIFKNFQKAAELAVRTLRPDIPLSTGSAIVKPIGAVNPAVGFLKIIQFYVFSSNLLHSTLKIDLISWF